MMKKNVIAFASLIAVIGALIVGLARAQDADDPFDDGGNSPINAPTTVFSRVQFIQLDGDIMRLDTATGALSRFRGTETGRNARGTFDAFAQPVSGPTSGFVEIQQVDDAVFLVDVVTGETWILRQRGSIASWVQVNIRD